MHPNDDVNRSQSSNDTFPTAMHIAAVEQRRGAADPGGDARCATRSRRRRARFADVVKIGRTHLQDAVAAHARAGDLGLGAASSITASSTCAAALPHLRELALGGTAVGTGLNAPRGFGERAAPA